MFSKAQFTQIIHDANEETLFISGVRDEAGVFLGKPRNLMLTRARVKTASLLERGGHDYRRGGQVESPILLLELKSGPSWETLHFPIP